MKTRLASSIALAAAIALGATGCSLAAPQGTTDPYAPSDGIDVTVAGVEVRNLLLVAADDGEHFNVVFTGVNNGDSAVPLTIDFVDEDGSATASADFVVQPGTELFGDPDGDTAPVLVSIPSLIPGASVTAYLQVPGGADVERQVPALDGTLPEYERFVLSRPTILVPNTAPITAGDEAAEEQAAEEDAE